MVLTEALSHGNGHYPAPSPTNPAYPPTNSVAGHGGQSSQPNNVLVPPPQGCNTGNCGGDDGGDPPTHYIYALGKVEWRIPDPSVTHELMQALGTPDFQGGYELAKLLLPENRYLARRLVWVLMVQGQETFYLKPKEPSEFKLLLDAATSEFSLVVGIGNAPADQKNLPTVWFNQIYHFNLAGLFQNLCEHLAPEGDSNPAQPVLEIYRDLFERIIYTANNAGHQPQFRALNYLAVRYPAIYGETSKIIRQQNLKLIGLEVQHSQLNFGRKVENVIFVFMDRQTQSKELYAVSVDVTGEFPFLVKPFSRYNELKSCSCGG
jgi:PatG C-terminal